MLTALIRRSALGAGLVLVGCPSDGSSSETSLPTPNGTASMSATSQTDETSASSTTDDSTTSSGVGTTTSTDGSDDSNGPESGSGCDSGCMRPPGDCHAIPGECVDDACVYTPKDEGEPCDDGDLCTVDDVCDDAGSCVPGEATTCDRPNSEDGACVDGECQGWSCIDPYENCDGDWDNGCEIPTGVVNSCNNLGLQDQDACGTAYCGIEVGPSIVNFSNENYRCVMCSNCTVPQAGQVSWCNQNTGHWWPPEDGACTPSFEHVVCEP